MKGWIAPAEPLIGVEDVAPPEWVADRTAGRRRGSVKPLLRAVTTVARLGWSASPLLLTLVAGLQVLSGLATAFGLLATADVFTVLLGRGPTPERVVQSLPAIAAFVGALALRALVETGVSAAQAALAPRVSQVADDRVIAAVVGVELRAFDDADFRELLRQGGQNGRRAIEATVRELTGLAADTIAILAACLTVGALNPWLTPVLLLAAVAEGLATTWVARLRYAHFLRTVTLKTRKSVIEEAATHRDFALERHAFTLQSRLLAEYRRVNRDLVRQEVRLQHRVVGASLLGRAAGALGIGAAYVVLGLLLHAGSMELALSGTAVMAMRTTSAALTDTMRAVNAIYEHSLYVELFDQLLAEAAARTRAPSAVPAPAPEEIRLKDVWFTYPGQRDPALREITMSVRRGQTIALVGQNGSGKSTLGRLLTGLYPPTRGTVLWDGLDLGEADPASIHDRIAVVAQSPATWPMTARLNVRIGRLGRDDPERGWTAAMRASGAGEVIAGLPKGADTVLSRHFRDGQELSGGQWQRLGVARALYRDAAVLLLDEPTSALDAHAEARVFEHVRADDGRVVIIVTHRLANIRAADHIYVLDRGRIVEHGTHDELLARPGHYRSMYEAQAAAYTDRP
ncbi:ABC transporter ATP-binding protein [Nonomuraea sp. GTA35]|uniref:ABC transporter ATP-binding protein n=1 Tax=Nonomuraea sp. GTA35 TaxID=1676746 RepID=UPI0035C262D9